MLSRSFKLVDTKRFEIFIEDVTINENELLLKVDNAAICKADLRYYLGKRHKRTLDLKYPLCLIHEATAVTLKDNSKKMAVGQKVILVPNIVNNKCEDCKCDRQDLQENYCPKAFFASSNYDGFSREVLAFPRKNVVKIPEAASGSIFVFCELISVAVAAIRRVNRIDKNSHIVIYGDGILGYLLCAVLRIVYDCTISVVGKHNDKLTKFIMCDKTYILDDTSKLKNDYAIAFECVGGLGSEVAINDIINHIQIGGEIILTGVSENNININTRKILEKGLSVKGSTRSCIDDFQKSVLLFENPTFLQYIKPLILGERFISNIDDYYDVFEEELLNVRLGKYILHF